MIGINKGKCMSLSHFLHDSQLTQIELMNLLKLARIIKHQPEQFGQVLAGKSIVTLFEKPSLRTHVSFDIGIQKLGGHSLYIGQQNGQLGERERVKDVAKNLSRWADAIVARVFKQSVLEEMAEYGSVPVVNALSDLYHPCQALADFVTLSEQFENLSQVKLAYIGDGNNVAHSLMLMSMVAGTDFTLVCPKGYEANSDIIQQAQALSQQSGAKLTITANIDDIGAQDVLYADTWVSMGDNTKVDEIAEIFMPYQLNHQLMATTGAKFVMHCQPAHLEQEITTALFDSDCNLAFEQAENRMWAQNAVLVSLLAPEIAAEVLN
jgi:ornithine carbamoyltransferase